MIEINYNIDAAAGWKKNFPYFKKYISKTVNATLNIVDVGVAKNVSITFLLTSNKKIKELNMKFRKKNKPTNVLSFPMQSTYRDNYLLGDIVLANQTLLQESIELRVKKYDYLSKMTIHGMLHLLGYDHKTEKQYKQMKKFENLIYNSVKLEL